MLHKQLFALTAALILTAGMFIVFGGAATPEPAPVPTSPPLAEPPSTMGIVFTVEVIGAEALAEAEDELTEAASSRAAVSTTTTTTTTVVATRAKTTSPSSPESTTTTTSPDSPPTADVGEYRSDYESDFFGRINSLRASNGLSDLNRNGSLNA